MNRPLRPLIFVLALTALSAAAPAQISGLRGASRESGLIDTPNPPDAVAVERVITIEGVAEVRVAPTKLRVVFAVAAQAEGAEEATAAGRAQLAETKAKLAAAGVAEADLDTDFIAAFPVYEWKVEKWGGNDVLAERRAGTRVQYNLHATVPDEAAALAAVGAALGPEGVDLLAVDYWSDDLTAKQAEAQKQAVAAARAKADLLLAGFPERPRPINVWEGTRVLFPHELYRRVSAVGDSAQPSYPRGDDRNELPRVPAVRPLQVYYRGLFEDVDVVEATMPGRREIEIISTVRLYFAAPGRPSEPDAEKH